MSKRVRIASIVDVPEGVGKELTAAGRVISLYNVHGKIYAMDGVCPHAGGPLGKGTLDGSVVTCPWHGWQLDVSTGRHCLNANIQQTTYPVTLEGEDIYVEID